MWMRQKNKQQEGELLTIVEPIGIVMQRMKIVVRESYWLSEEFN